MKIVRSIHCNLGIQQAYYHAINTLIKEMVADVESNQLATDSDILNQAIQSISFLKRKFSEFAKKWITRFDTNAPILAEKYMQAQGNATDKAFRSALKDVGWAVDFHVTPQIKMAINGAIAENVGLIKSIPKEYFGKIEDIVVRNYEKGRDLKSMADQIEALGHSTRKRAVLIARDQSNKLNGVIQKTRQTELGIDTAIWMHSHAGKQPRPDHVAAHRKEYKVSEGCLISGKYIYPGELINCRCSARSVIKKPA